jgi:hypothetical protein
MTLTYLIGIATTALLLTIWVELVPSLPAAGSRFLREATNLRA